MKFSNAQNKNHDLLSHEETVELIKKAQEGNGSAQDILVNHNLGLIRSVIKKFSNRGYDSEDIFQLGSIGLIKAIQKFDTSYNVKFSTYAIPMIIGEIRRFLRDDGIIKVSRSLKQTANKVKQSKERLSKELGREPTIQEISEEIKVDKEDIVMALESNYSPDYLYDIIHQNDGSPIHLIDKIEDEDPGDFEIVDKITLKESIRKLNARERQIIMLRYFKDKTQTEIAKELGISQVQVSRIEKKVLSNLKDDLMKA
ncbi:RNA polymerase sporulation sigma factor SigF [Clostridium sp. D2Q-14]|uniref:RNA polymerase sporulation sigma factor SigF n=1 Tax=Anaeromonas gelatinilytica TaxID=2683194 RepID=UPI00193C732B|nr:RNA polymerase sporulation sigma factor SigF [Anaeromonas gelatinilytica]MBS4534272.1 RNA polymerase sporulation sigma factor SigF [Anaeromonas gelatinilytica]